jgi:hypothetical protein
METSAEMYRQIAAQHRAAAEIANDPAVRDALLGLSLALERLARVIDPSDS